MQLSAQEEYGLRCLLQVARHEGGEPLRIPEIAAREGLSPEYTAKLMRGLRQGGLVASTRGATGGYRLARPAAEVSVLDALTVLGGPLFSEAFCSAHPGNRRDCVHSTDCSVRALWRCIGAAVHQVLRGITLADMARGEQPMGLWLDRDEPLAAAAASLADGGLVQIGGSRAAGAERREVEGQQPEEAVR
jgi:Rrf2 family transcriptional regulator, iron-sulfur cluster assembly transcription factor